MDRHYLEEELYSRVQATPEIFDFLTSGSLDGVWYWDLENPEQEWLSPRFWTTLGYDPSGMPHSPAAWQDKIHPADGQAALEAFKAHAADPDVPYDQLLRYTHKSGSTVWIRCRGLILRDPTGKPVRMLGAHTDVTAIKEAELRALDLRRTLEETRGLDLLRAESVLKSSADAIVAADVQGIITTWNPAAERLLGWTRDEAVGQSADIMTPPEMLKEHTLRARVRAGKQVVNARTIRRHKDGRRIHVALTGAMVHDEHGTPAGYAGILRDITEELAVEAEREELVRKLQAQTAALTQAQQAYQRLYDESPDMYVSVDAATGLVTQCNGRLLAKTGFTRDEVIGRPILARYHRSSAADAQRCHALSVAEGRVENERLVLQKKDGSKLHVLLNVESVRDGSGTVIRSRAAWRDITAQHLAEELQEKLWHADRLASLGQLAAGVAHEVNNPLGYVLGNLDLLLEAISTQTLDPAELQERLEECRDGARRIARLTRELRTFSRSQPDSVSRVDLNELVDIACRMTKHEIRHRAVLDAPPGPSIKLYADQSRLVQVLTNLMLNAAQSIEPGHPRDNRVSVTVVRMDNDNAMIAVSDTGCGIPGDDLAKIFEPFYSTKSRDVGTGLGLSLSREIARQHGGELLAHSTVGQGSRLELHLPLDTGLDPSRSDDAVPLATTRKRVLLIDDEVLLLGVYARLLRGHHDIIQATGGQQAIELLMQGTEVDAVLCDLMMPEVDGVAVYGWILTHKPELASRVLFCSGGAFTSRARAFLKTVNNPLLEKPIEGRTMLNAIAEITAD